jgi:hypothetical protein
MQHLHHLLIQANTELSNGQYSADKRVKSLQCELKDIKVLHKHELQEVRIRHELAIMNKEKELA